MFSPTILPAWASEGSSTKFFRAVKTLRTEGKEPTEEAVKELYVKLGGLLVTPSVEAEPEPVPEAPKRRSKKSE